MIKLKDEFYEYMYNIIKSNLKNFENNISEYFTNTDFVKEFEINKQLRLTKKEKTLLNKEKSIIMDVLIPHFILEYSREIKKQIEGVLSKIGIHTKEFINKIVKSNFEKSTINLSLDLSEFYLLDYGNYDFISYIKKENNTAFIGIQIKGKDIRQELYRIAFPIHDDYNERVSNLFIQTEIQKVLNMIFEILFLKLKKLYERKTFTFLDIEDYLKFSEDIGL